MGKWKIIQPAAGENYVRNPSAEGTLSYAAHGGGAVTRVTTYAAYGEYSYRIVPGGTARGIRLTCFTLPTPVWVSFLARSVTGTLTVDCGGAAVTMAPVQDMGDSWTLYLSIIQVATAGLNLDIHNSVNETWYLDAVMAYEGNQYQTYLDGDQPGCRWLADAWDSAAVRLATTRAGGNILDLEDDLYVRVGFPRGGLTAVNNISSPRPLQAGGSVDSTKVLPTVFVLASTIAAPSAVTLNARQMALADLLMPDRVPLGADGRPQPVRLQYWGAARVLELCGSYEGGLDGVQRGYQMQIAPALRAANDPYWGEIVTRGATLVTQEAATTRLVFRVEPDGDWDEMGPPSAVTTDPDDYFVFALAQNSRYIYVGGMFRDLDANANLDRLAAFDRETGTWVDITGGNPPDDEVLALLLDTAGNLWVGGTFHNVGGIAAPHIAMRSAAGVWSCPGGAGVGANDVVYALTMGAEGMVFAGGDFTSWGGVACNRVARYWHGLIGAIDVGLDDTVRALAYTTNLGRLYAGGDFANYLQYNALDGTAWQTLAPGSPGNVVRALAAIRVNAIAYGGDFTTIDDGATASARVAFYFEDAISYPLPNGPADNVVRALAYEPRQNILYAGGGFASCTGLPAPLGVCALQMAVVWPFTWEVLPVTFSWGSPACYAICVTARDVRFGADKVFGFNSPGTVTWPGEAVVTLPAVAGGAESRPVLHITRSGGATHDATIAYLENVTTGKRIYLDEPLADGEELFIDLVNLHIYSTFGGVVEERSPRPGSQFASWTLLPGGNDLYLRTTVSNPAVTVTGLLHYQQKYHSFVAADN